VSKEEAHKVASRRDKVISPLQLTDQLAVIKVEILLSDSTNTDCNQYVKVYFTNSCKFIVAISVRNPL